MQVMPVKYSPILLYSSLTLLVYKVSMSTNTYPHKPLRTIKVTICNHQADTSCTICDLMSDPVICKFRKSMVIHDTECPY